MTYIHWEHGVRRLHFTNGNEEEITKKKVWNEISALTQHVSCPPDSCPAHIWCLPTLVFLPWLSYHSLQISFSTTRTSTFCKISARLSVRCKIEKRNFSFKNLPKFRNNFFRKLIFWFVAIRRKSLVKKSPEEFFRGSRKKNFESSFDQRGKCDCKRFYKFIFRLACSAAFKFFIKFDFTFTYFETCLPQAIPILRRLHYYPRNRCNQVHHWHLANKQVVRYPTMILARPIPK